MRISDWSSDVCSSDLLIHHAHEQFRSTGELLHRMGEPAIPLFLGAGENAVTKTKCAPFSALNNTQTRRWIATSFPALGNADDVLPVHTDDAQPRQFRTPPTFAQRPPRPHVHPAPP